MKDKLVLLVSMVLLASLAAAQPSVEIDVNKKVTEPTPLQTSEYADIWIEVTNDGSTRANNVNLSFRPTYPFSVDPDERTSWDLGNLVPGEEYNIRLQVKVDENAVQGENYLTFFTKNSNNNVGTEHKVPVEVRSDNNILSLNRIDLQDTVAPGSTASMTLELENMADTQLKNIEVSLDLTDLPLATSGPATKYLQKIEPGATDSTAFELRADESAENGVYRLPISFEYENEAGTAFTRETSTAVVVGGEPALEIGINSEEQLTRGSTQTLTLRVVNRGYGSANFVQINLNDGEGYEVVTPSTVYLGEMDPDDYQTAEFDVYISGAENISMPVTLDYQYEGAEQETVTLSPRIYSSSELRQYGLSGSSNIVPVVVVVLIAAAVGYYYWRRKRRE